jgi:hypothetical protein
LAWLIELIQGRTKNAYRILVRKRLENMKGIWQEKIRLTFVGIYHGVHLLLIKQDNGAVGFDAVWSGRGYRACGNALPYIKPCRWMHYITSTCR